MKPVGNPPGHGIDQVNECNGHGSNADGGDRNGKEHLESELRTLDLQNGIVNAAAGVSGAILDPNAVTKGEGIEMTMKVCERVLQSEQSETFSESR